MLSERELAEWVAYYEIEPWGGDKADLRTGLICATLANIHRDPKRSRPFTPADFMLTPREPAPPPRLAPGADREAVASNVIALLDGWNEQRERQGGVPQLAERRRRG